MSLRHLQKNLTAGADLLDAMSNPVRLKVLCILAGQEVTVSSLAAQTEMSQSALSQHLAKLRSLNLVMTRRDAQTIYYKCENPAVLRVLKDLVEIFTPAPEELTKQSYI